jgi:hypothetical protein
MGMIRPVPRPQPEQPRLNVVVSQGLHDRVMKAAKRMEQSAGAYVRMALLEKLERDGR